MIVNYGSTEFEKTCDELLTNHQNFVVIGGDATAARHRNAVRLFLKSTFDCPKDFIGRMKLVAKLAFASMSAASLLVICNRAIVKKWKVTVLDAENQIACFEQELKVPGSN